MSQFKVKRNTDVEAREHGKHASVSSGNKVYILGAIYFRVNAKAQEM
jgi:hypothetical protein